MNFNLFGKSKSTQSSTKASSSRAQTQRRAQPKPDDPASSVVKLKENIAQQDKQLARLDKQIAQCVQNAKDKMAKKDKRGAMFSLKRKKMYEKQIEKIENTKMTLETQVITLESAVQNQQTIQAMSDANNALTNIRNTNDAEKVDDLMDKIKEEMDQVDEISDAIAQPIDPYAYDEDELLDELNQLEEDDLEAELLKPTPAEKSNVSLPSVPDSKLPEVTATVDEEEAALKALEAEMEALAG